MLGDLGLDQLAAGPGHRLQGVAAAHSTQPQPVVGGRGDPLAQGFDLGQVLLAEADDDSVVVTAEGDLPPQLGLALDPFEELARRAALDQIRQLGDPAVGPALGLGAAPADGEQLLELVEDQHGGDEPIALVPQLGVGGKPPTARQGRG